EVLPDLRLVDVPRGPDVRVHVDEPGHDRFAADVDRLRAGGNRHLAAAPDRRDTVVGHDDVGVLDDFVPLHRDRARAAQDDGPGRFLARGFDDDFRAGGFIRGLLPLFFFFVLAGGLLVALW